MNPTIKARIESIRRGEVPEGYKRTKAGIMPVPWCKEKTYQAKDLFVSVSDKKHGGTLEVLSATQDRGIVPRRLVDIDIKYDDSNLGTYKKVDKGDFVISLRSFQGGIEYSDYVGIVSPAYTVVRSKQKIVSGYYKAYFKTEDFIKRLNIGTYGIRDGKQVSFDDFGDMVLHYPPVNEQEKIAEILAGQDRVIALKEKLLAEKQKQKKYLMQQLLTAKKRLPGFSGEWKKVRMGTYVNFQVGYPFSSLHFNEEGKGLRLIKNRDLKTDDQIYYTTEHYSQDFVVTNGDVLIGMDGDFLPCVWNKGRALLNQRVGKIFVASGMDLMFSYYCLHIPLEKLSSKIGATTVKHLAHKDVESLFVFIPIEKPEQIAIAEILSTADKEIELLKKDIEQEKLKKKSLMQLLLTGIVRVDELVS